MVNFGVLRDKSQRLAKYAADAAAGNPNTPTLSAMICWEAAIECARLSGAISDRGAIDLNAKAAGGNADRFAPIGGAVQVISSQAQFLSIPAGCFIAFCGPNLGGGPGRVLSHVMVSLGNGRAAGANNGLLDGQANWHAINVHQRLFWKNNLAEFNMDNGRNFEIRVIDIDSVEAARCIIL
jgi:hypothetical protein